MNKKDLIEYIKVYFPEGLRKNIQEIHTGINSQIFLLGRSYVVRVKRDGSSFLKEKNYLCFLQKYISHIPKCVHLSHDGSLMIVNYISGKPLGSRRYHRQSDIIKNQFAYDIALFLSQLHALPIDCVETPLYHKPSIFASTVLESQKLLPIIAYDKTLCEDIQKVIGDNNNIVEKVILHNDLYDRNILIDKKSHKLSGIIDYSDLTIGDYHVDFTRLRNPSHDLLDRVAYQYTLLTKRSVDKDKIKRFSKAFVLSEYNSYLMGNTNNAWTIIWLKKLSIRTIF